MVFCPANFWTDSAYPRLSTLPNEVERAKKLYDKQLIAYAFVTLRSVGEQPGKVIPLSLVLARAAGRRHHRTVEIPGTQPAAISLADPSDASRLFSVLGFSVTNNIPFPSGPRRSSVRRILAALHRVQSPGAVGIGRDEFIPVVRGRVNHARDAAKNPSRPRRTFPRCAGREHQCFSAGSH